MSSTDQQQRWRIKRSLLVLLACAVLGIGGIVLMAALFYFFGTDTGRGRSIGPESSAVAQTGLLVSFAMMFLSVIGFIPLSVLAYFLPVKRFSDERNMRGFAGDANQIRIPIPASVTVDSGEEEWRERRKRAREGKNSVGLAVARKKHSRRYWATAWIVLGLFCVLPVTVVGVYLGVLPGAAIFLGVLGTGASLIVFAYVAFAQLARGLTTSADVGVYQNYYRGHDEETLAWGLEEIRNRPDEESLSPVPRPDGERDRKRLRSSLSSSLGIWGGASEWELIHLFSRTLWTNYGHALLGRELAVRSFADEENYSFTPYVSEEYSLLPSFLSAVADSSSYYYQCRNSFVLPHSAYPVRFTDLIVVGVKGSVIVGRAGSEERELNIFTGLRTFTYAETWFPADHWLHAYPESAELMVAEEANPSDLEATARIFNMNFHSATGDERWGRIVLNPAVMAGLLRVQPLSHLSIDAGRIALLTHSNFLPVAGMLPYAELLRNVTRSARAAESEK